MLWVAVIAWLVVVVAFGVWAGLRARRVMKQVGEVRQVVDGYELQAKLEHAQLLAAALEPKQQRLQEATARFNRTRQKMAYLDEQVDLALGPLRSLRSFMPRG